MGTYGLNNSAVGQTANQTGKGNRRAYITSPSRGAYRKAYITSPSRKLYPSRPKRRAYTTYNLTNYLSRAKPSGINTGNNTRNNTNTSTGTNAGAGAGANTSAGANTNTRADISTKADTGNSNINTNNTNT